MKTIYFKSSKEILSFLNRLKLTACPSCHQTGFLNKHDTLQGPWKNKGDRFFKGRRAYCSNRKNRKGCGKTIALLLSSYIKFYSVPSGALWRLLLRILSGWSVRRVFNSFELLLSLSTLYRLYSIFTLSQVKIRTLLKTLLRAQDNNCINAIQQTIRHLQSCFPDCFCPVSAFQHCFQTSIF